MLFRQIFDEALAQYAYLIGCQRTGEALLVDPERDVDRYLELARAEGLRVTAATETHIHADFLSGCRELARRGLRIYLSDEGSEDWRYTWPEPDDDVVLLKDRDRFRVGNIVVEARHTPGHTPEHLSFLVTDEGGGADAPMGVASGDFVFVGSLGRPDLLETAAGHAGAREPSARALFRSVQAFLELPDYLQVWPGHGAGSACGKALGSVPESTVGYERRFNAAIETARTGEEAFVRDILEGQPEPPLYFARMKRLNRDGAPILGSLPRPEALDARGLAERSGDGDTLVVDSRRDRAAFMQGHLPGSLYAPLDRSFPTAVGSLVEPETPLVLIVEADRVEEAVRLLVRVGLDRVEGWAPPAALEAVEAEGATLGSIEQAEMLDLDARRRDLEAVVVDVRRLDEYEAGHVPGAVLAPHVRLPEVLDALPADRTLLVHCRTGARAAVAASWLARAGRRVVYVDGAFGDWAGRNLEQVERGAPEATAAPT